MTTQHKSKSLSWKNKFRDKLIEIIGATGVISSDDELIAYECDALTGYRIKPIFVVLPKTTEEVSAVIKECHHENIPFVPRGAGTGLSGGALPTEEGIVISLSRMTKILDVDIPNQRVVVEPGVVNISVTNAVSSSGYYYAPDPSSQIVCTIGGNVAENSGGVHCLKYGVTTNHVLGLEMVLPDGEIIEVGGKTLDHPGYDLTGLVVGSEGLLGIVTKVTLKIIKKPEAVKTLLASFDHIEDAGDSVSGITARGVIPAGMEIMDSFCIRAVEEAVGAGYPIDAGAILLVELDGPTAEVQAQMPIVEEVLKENNAIQIKVAKDAKERELLWKGRKSAFPAMGRISPDYYVQDGVIPRSKLAEVLGEIEELSKKYGLRVANVFHAGDGNLHPLVLYDSSKEGDLDKTLELAGEILQVCVDKGGSITGEHGVGHDKKRFLSLMFDENDLDTMNLLRCAFDTKGLCNPGKLFPTPRTCVEPGMKPFKEHPVQKAGLGEMY
ncbi:MAG: FAD-binding protein [Candidatus Dadabacteria bacterium]|nr:FAD-binding protein [Candidatus Dadabacteria bacterium]MCZ6639805.1 FAD-binding protein [Candidatus Dadabacteria bacterium]MCZ6864216.1 FAD-binding protein [Candidatus Dadabacteria bacterium]